MTEQREQTFVIFRQADKDSESYYERFSVPLKPGMTVLDALFYIQDYLDSTLAFRYSCRGSICGSCGMTIDKFPQLACKTQISQIKKLKKPKLPELKFGEIEDWDAKEEILVEPLPNMEVEKDLVVNMDRFWKFYREVQPFFAKEWNEAQPETKQSPDNAKRIEHLIYCIMCGICWTCPVSKKNKQYIGPAALAKAYRFIHDSRISESHKIEVLEQSNQDNGVPACESIYACNRVCPKGVRPGTAIRNIREEKY